MEIERKFLIKKMPEDLERYAFHRLEQGYLNTDPVVRVRKEDDAYYLTYKGRGFLAREEYNLPLNAEAYAHLIEKADGNIIRKNRYLIPLEGTDLTIELDVFDAPFAPLTLAEVEFTDIEQAKAFIPPEWFGEDVTQRREYSNSYLSRRTMD